MSEANGTAAREPTPFERIVEWLPHLSDRDRGRLRALLVQPALVRREGVVVKPKEATEGES